MELPILNQDSTGWWPFELLPSASLEGPIHDMELSLRLYLSADEDEEDEGELAEVAAACLLVLMLEVSRPKRHLCKDSTIPKLLTLSPFPDAPLSEIPAPPRLSGPPLAVSSLSSSAQRSLCLCLCLCLWCQLKESSEDMGGYRTGDLPPPRYSCLSSLCFFLWNLEGFSRRCEAWW